MADPIYRTLPMPRNNTGVNNNQNYKTPFSGYDQFQQFMDKFGSQFGLNRNGNGYQGAVQGTDVTQFGRPINADPRFADVLAPLYNPMKIEERGQDYFERGINASNPSQGISPETQSILDIIEKNRQFQSAQGGSQAASLAARRGIQGSSTEAFGAAQAGESANRAAQDSTANLLLANLQRNQGLQDLQSRALFERGNQVLGLATPEAQLNAARLGAVANLTSDELASIRNLSEADKNRFLQEKLGKMGINAQNNATRQARDAADQANDPFNLIIGGIGAGIGSPFHN